MRVLFLLASSFSCLISCKRDLVPAAQKESTAASAGLKTANPNSLAIPRGTPTTFPVQMAMVSTVVPQPGNFSPFAEPTSVASDAAGNIYIADQDHNLIKKMSPSGTVTTFAGDGNPSWRDGPVANAEFNTPAGIAVGPDGTLYIADQGNYRIRTITTDGQVHTLAGNGKVGALDGAGNLAEFNLPFGIAVDNTGTVYVADFGNNEIRKITPAGLVSTWCGQLTAGYKDGTGAAALFNGPKGIAVSPTGAAFVADVNNQRVRMIVNGTSFTLAGNGVASSLDGTGKTASFNFPSSVTLDAATNCYVTDRGGNCIRKVTIGGVVTTIAGSNPPGSVDSYDSLAKFFQPTGITIDPVGNIFVADRLNESIRKINNVPAVRTLAGNGATGYAEGTGAQAQINQPYSVTVDAAGNIYFEDLDFRFRKVTASGTTSFLAGNGFGYAEGQGKLAMFRSHTDMITDPTGNLFVADGNNHRIRKITPGGLVSTFAGNGVFGFNNGSDTGAVCGLPSSLVLDGSGNMFFTEFFVGLVRKISASGIVSNFDSIPSFGGIAPTLYSSTSDATGTLYVTSANQGKIYKVTAKGIDIFFDGQSTAGTPIPNFQPLGIAIDASGKVYVVDLTNNRIDIFSPAGQVIGQVGDGQRAFRDAPLSQAEFNAPTGIAINRSTGILYIADQGNSRLRIMGVQ